MRRIAVLVAGAAFAAAGVVAASPAPAADSWSSGHVRFTPTPGATLLVEGVGEFRGSIEVRRAGGGLAVINELPLEEYLLGLAEVPSTWPAAALEAQVIAARTFALYSQLVRSSAPHREAGADICATQSCQVYEGIARERRDVGGAWAAAVRRTAHRFVLYRGGPILAKYASSNGGHSDAGGAPYLPAVPDPDDLAVSPWARWTSVIPLDQVAAAFPGGGTLVEVIRTGDVFVLRRQQEDGTLTEEGHAPANVRRVLNRAVPTPPGVPVPVPSIRFVARTENGQAVLDGAGYGHLVGMSQYGALGKARRGLAADDILAAYYGGLRSTAIAPERLPATIRVAVALDHPATAIRPVGGRLRVDAADGGAVALLSAAPWRVTAAAQGVAVEGAHPPLAVQAERVRHDLVRVILSAPATVVVHDPVPRLLGLLEAGAHDLATTRDVAVRVEADAGGGRRATVDVPAAARAPVAVGSAVAPGPRLPRPEPAPPAEPKLAMALLAGALTAGTGAVAGRRLPLPGRRR